MTSAPVTLSEPQPLNGADINGDAPLTPAQLRAYTLYHEARNRANIRLSREQGVSTRPIPLALVKTSPISSPARVMVSAFFAMAARRLAPAFKDRAVTMLDLGCGSGTAVLPFFEEAGFRGRYIGLDIAAHKNFPATTSRTFTRELILDDVHTLDVSMLPPIDLLVSATALEHIRDDAGSIARLSERLAPGAAQVHYVPGEAALPLYGQHGWRQYSPHCLRTIFPTADLYRAGGYCSSAFHQRTITKGGPNALRERHVGLYRHLRNVSLVLDRALGNHPSTMYGVIVPPANTATNSAAQRAAA